MFVTGPDVLKTVTNENVTKEELGGHEVHSMKSGVAHRTFTDEIAAIANTRALLSFLPSSSHEAPRRVTPPKKTDEKSQHILSEIIPSESIRSYDSRMIIDTILDHGQFYEVMPKYADNIVTGFGRVDGWTVGIVANQPRILAGCLDINASVKAARFVRFCDCYNIPIVTLVDVPGFLPGTT
jgi:propionyl-CoA carboxylase beta chain